IQSIDQSNMANNICLMMLMMAICCSYLANGMDSSVTMRALPEVLETSSDLITITWKGVESPTKYDVIAIYYPVDSGLDSPIGYIYTSNSTTTWRNGYGSVTFPLVNVRDTYVFRLWIKGDVPPVVNWAGANLTLASTSNNVTFLNPNEPTKPYLALTNHTSEMRLMWISGTDDTPYVYYGDSPNTLSLVASGTSKTYNITHMCDSPANDPRFFRNPGFIHDVVMTGLKESSQYYYSFGSKMSGYSVKTYSFVSAPKVGTEAYVIAFGDMGVNPPFKWTFLDIQVPASKTMANVYQTIAAPYSHSPLARKLGKSSPTGDNIPPPWSVLHIGDLSYARGYGYIWDVWHEAIQGPAAMAPYMVSIGNHEYDYYGAPFMPEWADYGHDSGGECGVPYNARFHMPGAEGMPSQNIWFSYDNGPIHFTQASFEHDFTIGSPQYQWLEQDMATIDRTKTPWLVFSAHRPMYDSEAQEDEAGMYTNILLNIEPLIIKYDVNLALWGHDHAYERMCGIAGNWTCAESDNDAPVHVLIGMAGNTYQAPWWITNEDDDGDGYEVQPDFSIFRTMNYGYTRFYANTTNLYFEFVGDQRNEVHDSFWLTSKYTSS
ncbi:hypothetical protein SAMD00019534_006200, partial [Acytostelium subglobosum LB1]|uniref:hypothetical protein n=1 Tax=Acytostelium subglobosum LB1 TaxID=1410327 RepID=UPI0006447FC2